MSDYGGKRTFAGQQNARHNWTTLLAYLVYQLLTRRRLCGERPALRVYPRACPHRAGRLSRMRGSLRLRCALPGPIQWREGEIRIEVQDL